MEAVDILLYREILVTDERKSNSGFRISTSLVHWEAVISNVITSQLGSVQGNKK